MTDDEFENAAKLAVSCFDSGASAETAQGDKS